MTYGSGDLTLVWEVLVSGNPQNKKAKFRKITSVTVALEKSH